MSGEHESSSSSDSSSWEYIDTDSEDDFTFSVESKKPRGSEEESSDDDEDDSEWEDEETDDDSDSSEYDEESDDDPEVAGERRLNMEMRALVPQLRRMLYGHQSAEHFRRQEAKAARRQAAEHFELLRQFQSSSSDDEGDDWVDVEKPRRKGRRVWDPPRSFPRNLGRRGYMFEPYDPPGLTDTDSEWDDVEIQSRIG